METKRVEVDKILQDAIGVYEKLTGQAYLRGREPEVPFPPGVEPVEYLNQEYRYLMGLVESGALRHPFHLPFAWTPPAEVIETPKEYHVRLDLPGVDKNDISVTFRNHILTVRGERLFRRTEAECSYLFLERPYGEFVKQIPLPEQVDRAAAEARYSDGVLEVRVPKARHEGEVEDQSIRVR
jgi:HSP20 family molecular chaperone IbpA